MRGETIIEKNTSNQSHKVINCYKLFTHVTKVKPHHPSKPDPEKELLRMIGFLTSHYGQTGSWGHMVSLLAIHQIAASLPREEARKLQNAAQESFSRITQENFKASR